MATSKIHHVHWAPTAEGDARYYTRDDLMRGGLFSPGIGDIIIQDGNYDHASGVEGDDYKNRTNTTTISRSYYSIIG